MRVPFSVDDAISNESKRYLLKCCVVVTLIRKSTITAPLRSSGSQQENLFQERKSIEHDTKQQLAGQTGIIADRTARDLGRKMKMLMFSQFLHVKGI